MNLSPVSFLFNSIKPSDLERALSTLTRACSGGNLKALRESRRLSQDALAAMAGISQPALSKIEIGTNTPTAQTALRLWVAIVGDDGGTSPRVCQVLSDQEEVHTPGEGKAMSIAATITTSIASSSGARTCLVCSERITDRTMIVEFRTQDKRTDVTMHLFCAGQLWGALGEEVVRDRK